MAELFLLLALGLLGAQLAELRVGLPREGAVVTLALGIAGGGAGMALAALFGPEGALGLGLLPAAGALLGGLALALLYHLAETARPQRAR
jgi:hypothetical protein